MKKLIKVILAELTGRIMNRRRFNNPFCWVRLRMYRSLARNLVDKKDWYMIKLYSGMQTPLLDAIEYLVMIEDRSSVPRLKELLAHYLKKPDGGEARTSSWGGGEVSCLYGPMDYMPERVQTAAIRALLALVGKEEAAKLAQELLAQAETNGLCERSIEEVTEFLGLEYIGRGFWKDDARFTAPFSVPTDSVTLQQGYRGRADGSFIEHFLVYAKKSDYVISKQCEDSRGIAWITAVLVLGKSPEKCRAVKVKYILDEDGTGTIDGSVVDYDFYDGSYAGFDHLWLRFRKGILPEVRLEPAV